MVVFTTAYPEFEAESYEYDAIDVYHYMPPLVFSSVWLPYIWVESSQK
jgi:hypothetical protein